MSRPSKGKYIELKDAEQEDDDAGSKGDGRSSSIDSNSPILPAIVDQSDESNDSDVDDDNIDEEASLKSAAKSFPADEGLEVFYKPVDGYEGAHRFDPKFQWTAAEEGKVVRKIDKWICSWVCLMFFALQLDRGNIVQALSDNFLEDLGLNTNDYNYGQAIFFFAFLCAELPSQLISKWLGPDRWIPIQMVTWSIIASCQAFLGGKTSFFICRALLGIIEGGFIPDNVLYLSYFYTGSELPRRLSFFWVSSQATNIVSAFFAYGILHLRGLYGIEGWRWLFALEGILTATIGVISWFYLPASPTETNGWFTAHEEKIMVNRILRDDPSKGDMHNRQALSWGMLVDCLTDWYMFPIYLIALTFGMPNNPMAAYLTIQLGDIGFGTFQTNLLTIPAYLLFILQLLFWTWLSEKLDQRFLVGLSSQIWALPLLLFLEYMPADTGHWVRFTITTLLVGHPYVHAILVAITSRNAGTVRTRTVASALYNMLCQASSIISQNVYRDDDRPLYRKGNKILIFVCIYNFALFIGAKVFYSRVNDTREKIWNSMTFEDKKVYLATTKDQGNKRLDFRFAH